MPVVQAATITVTNLNDSGPGSLRQAITNAAAGDTIDFRVTGVITLTSGQLTISKNLTITGPGESLLTISGNNNSRVFEISPGSHLVHISNLTIANGDTSDGGGIYNRSTAEVILENVTISGNTAGSLGGGIFNDSDSRPTLTNVIFSGNHAGHFGGGMFSDNNSSPTLTNVTFNNNVSDFQGGGMFSNTNSIPILADVTFRDNQAEFGGGMFNWSNVPTLTNVIFDGNQASLEGGGMYGYNASPAITNGTFTGNTAGTLGGGMYNIASSNPVLTNVTFTGNTAVNRGGGGIANYGSSPSLSGVTFNNNDAPDGGGMYNIHTSSPALTNVTFSDNTVGSSGAGMYNGDGCDPTLTYVTISGNAAGVSGGGMFSEEEGTPLLISTILAGNRAGIEGPDCLGSIDSGDYNIVGNASGCGFANRENDQVGTASDPINPLLAGLSDNGGETQTRALMTGSPAIDQIPFGVNGCGTSIRRDQRGESRPFPTGGECDIGAYELNTPSDLPKTGFLPGRITILPTQPAEKYYSGMGDLWLDVEVLGIQAPVVSVPVVGDRWDVSWLGSNVGYLQGTAFPTWKGNTVLTGHVWDAYNRPGLFIGLKQLSYGDRVEIHAWGLAYIYAVRENRLVSPDAVDLVIQHKEYDWITLLTCEDFRYAGDGYALRRMVRAVLIDVIADP